MGIFKTDNYNIILKMSKRYNKNRILLTSLVSVCLTVPTWISNRAVRAAASGRGMYIRFWKRLRMAGSRAQGMLVAARTRTSSLLLLTPCIWISNSVLMRFVGSASFSERDEANESISSKSTAQHTYKKLHTRMIYKEKKSDSSI